MPSSPEQTLLNVEEGEEGQLVNEEECAPPASRRVPFKAAVVAASLAALGAAGLAVAIVGQRTAAVPYSVAKTAAGNGITELSSVPKPSIRFGNDLKSGECPAGHSLIDEEAQCRAAMPLLPNGDPDSFKGSANEADWPKGCYYCNKNAKGCSKGVWFNPHHSGGSRRGALPICQQNFAIETGKTLFVGDSDVDYWHTFREAVPDAYNVGIGGNTCADALKEIDSLLAKFKPAWVVLVCGENDLDGDGASVSTTYKRWTAVMKKIRDAGARVVMMGTKPEPSTKKLHSKYQQYDTMVKDYAVSAAKETAPPPLVFVDVFKAFTATGNSNDLYDPSEKPDYLHMGPKGYSLWNRWSALANTDLAGCVVWEGDSCTAQAPPVITLAASACPDGYAKIETEKECRAYAGLARAGLPWQGTEEEDEWPRGCYLCAEGSDGCHAGTWFNGHSKGKANAGASIYCKRQ